MRSKLLIFISALILLGFVAFAFTRTIRFTEQAVVATFGKASEESVVREPGLIFRWPAPVQTVTVYDTRARLLTAASETQQTADNRQIIVQTFLAWRVSDPLKFFQTFGGSGSQERLHFGAAEDTLRPQLRSAMSEVSRYQLADLFAPQQGASKLGDLEQAIYRRMTESGEQSARPSDMGVELLLVGVDRIVLPEDTTREVFERMKATQLRLAAEAESRGAAHAAQIRASAEADANRILSFAQTRAAEIRVQGDREAAEWYAKMGTEQEFALFLSQIDALQSFLARNTTLILSTEMPGMSVFRPDALDRLRANGLPEFTGTPASVTEAPEASEGGAPR